MKLFGNYLFIQFRRCSERAFGDFKIPIGQYTRGGKKSRGRASSVYSDRRGWAGHTTPQPPGPADVSALQRGAPSRRAHGGPTSGRQCARSESFARLSDPRTRTLAAAQKFCHRPPPPPVPTPPTRRPGPKRPVVVDGGGALYIIRRCRTRGIGVVGGWMTGELGGQKFRNGFSSSKPTSPPPPTPTPLAPTRPTDATHAHSRTRRHPTVSRGPATVFLLSPENSSSAFHVLYSARFVAPGPPANLPNPPLLRTHSKLFKWPK